MTTPSSTPVDEMPEWDVARIASAVRFLAQWPDCDPCTDRTLVRLSLRLDERDREVAELRRTVGDYREDRETWKGIAASLRTRLEQAERERDEARTFQWNAFDEFLDSMRDANGPLAMASAAVTLRDALAALASHPTPQQGEKGE